MSLIRSMSVTFGFYLLFVMLCATGEKTVEVPSSIQAAMLIKIQAKNPLELGTSHLKASSDGVSYMYGDLVQPQQALNLPLCGLNDRVNGEMVCTKWDLSVIGCSVYEYSISGFNVSVDEVSYWKGNVFVLRQQLLSVLVVNLEQEAGDPVGDSPGWMCNNMIYKNMMQGDKLLWCEMRSRLWAGGTIVFDHSPYPRKAITELDAFGKLGGGCFRSGLASQSMTGLLEITTIWDPKLLVDHRTADLASALAILNVVLAFMLLCRSRSI